MSIWCCPEILRVIVDLTWSHSSNLTDHMRAGQLLLVNSSLLWNGSVSIQTIRSSFTDTLNLFSRIEQEAHDDYLRYLVWLDTLTDDELEISEEE